MILLDTNVISQPWRQAPTQAVIEWIDQQPLETLFLSAVTVAELRFGVACLPAGKRRDALYGSLEHRVLALFAGRVLAFDAAASLEYAVLMARARATGQTIGTADGYVAATAAAHGMSVATRDVEPFVAAGVTVINPWAS